MKKLLLVVSLCLLSAPIFAFASIDNNLYYGLQNNGDVKQLQAFLIGKGFLTGDSTGNFFSLTLKAVKAYQRSVGINSTGYVGTLTRTAINKQLVTNIPASNQKSTNGTGTISTTPITAPASASSPVSTSGAGLNNTTYLGILNNLNIKLQQNNPLIQQKNLVVKQWLGTPLTTEELNSLPSAVQSILQRGNDREIEMYIKILNGEIANYNNSVANNISQITKQYSTQATTPANTNQVSTLSQTPILPVVVSPNNTNNKKPLIIGQGSQYTDSLGITHFIGSNGYNGQASTDSLGILHYTDNTGYSSSTSTDSLGIQHTIDNRNNQINASTNSLGITNYGSIGSGLSGQSSKDNLGITHYTDNVGNKLNCSTDNLGITNCY